MPDKQQVEFIIKPDGTVEERVTGISGPDCEQVTRAIEDALGEVARREHTPDYYNTAQGQEDSVVTKT